MPLPSKAAVTARLPALTALRGGAALWGVLHHYAPIYLPNLHSLRYTDGLRKG